jgi:hypothetical protein
VDSRFGAKQLLAAATALSLLGCTSTAAPAKTADPKIAAIARLQRYLAGEHAAIWAYGRAAALLPKTEMAAALREIAKHERERDQLGRRLRAEAVVPVGALVAYDVPGSLTNAGDARIFLAGVESRLAALASTVKSVPAKP